MAVYKRDMVDINLETGNIHRSFLKHSIGYKDQQADHFGIRAYRNGEPVNLTGVSIQGIFMPPQGSPIAITSGNIVNYNEAEVVLPQACYNYDGQFTLAIKLVDPSNAVTGTMRIVDGMVDNTHASGTVAPVAAIPSYQEVLSTYEQAIAAINKTVRFDAVQSLTDTQKATARGNISAPSVADLQAETTAREAADTAINNAIGTVPSGKTVQGQIDTLESGKVPKTTTVNGHALSGNVTVTKADVGLGNVDNTSDVNKPVSTAQQAAIDAEAATRAAADADLKSAINPVINQANVLGDPQCKDTTTYSGTSTDYYRRWKTLVYTLTHGTGTIYSDAYYFDNDGTNKPYLIQDFFPSDLPSGTYYFSCLVKAVFTSSSIALSGSISVVGYPTSAHSSGTNLVSKNVTFSTESLAGSDYYRFSTTLNVPDGSSYNHLRFIIYFNTISLDMWFAEPYLSKVNGHFSAIGNEFENVNDAIAENEAEIEEAENDYNKKTTKNKNDISRIDSGLVPITIKLDNTEAEYTDNDIISVVSGSINHSSMNGFRSAKWDISDYVGLYLMVTGTSYVACLSWIITTSDGTALAYAEKPASGNIKNLDTVQIPETAKYLYYCSLSDGAYVGLLNSVTPMIVNGYMNNISGTGSNLILADKTWSVDGKFLSTKSIGSVPIYTTFSGYAVAMIRVIKGHTYHLHTARIYKQSSYVLTDDYFVTVASDYDYNQESVQTLTEYDGDITPSQNGWLLYQTMVNNVDGYCCYVYGNDRYVDDNCLFGKKLVTAGDSYTAASFSGDYAAYNHKNYGYYIAKRNNMVSVNSGIDGSTMAVSNPSNPSSKSPFSYQRYVNVPADTDYLVIWFGINDTAYSTLGEITDEENTTFYGAWNKVLKYYLTNYPFMKILIIVSPVAGSTYQQAVRDVAKKWGYPYLDWVKDDSIPAFFERDGMGSEALALRKNAFGWNGPVSGHPNPAWHEYESTIIESKLRSI